MAEQVVQIYNSDFLLPLISFVLITLVWMWLIYAFFADKAEGFGSQGTGILRCKVGECVTDKVTGEKKCPSASSTNVYAYDPSIQVCEPQGYCQGGNGYASQSDGSTNPFGLCQIDPSDSTGIKRVSCRCLSDTYCADYITNYFGIINGNPYIEVSGQSFKLEQINNPVYLYSSSTSNNQDLGLKVPNPQSSFCTIPIDWIYLTQPGCSYIPGLRVSSNSIYYNYFDQTKPVTLQESIVANALSCMYQNPCNYGVLSFITNNSSNFTINDISRLPVACTRGTHCNNDQVSIYDTSYGSAVCRQMLPS